MYRYRRNTFQCTKKLSIQYGCPKSHTISQQNVRFYSQGSSERKSGVGKTLFLIFGTATIGVGSTLAYAKYDSKFRNKLDETIPGVNNLMEFIFQEKKSISDNASDYLNDSKKRLLDSAYGLVGKSNNTKPVIDEKKLTKKEAVVEEPTKPKKIVNEKTTPNSKDKEANRPAEKEVSKPKAVQTPAKGISLPELERKAENATRKAILAFSKGREILKDYREQVVRMVDESLENDDHTVWHQIKNMSEEKDKLLIINEEKAEDAVKELEKALYTIDKLTDADESSKENVKEKIRDMIRDVDSVATAFDKEVSSSANAEKYWKKVEESRNHLSEELGILFPTIGAIEESHDVSEEEFELFVLYASQLIKFYQKELKKLETIGSTKIAKILELSKTGNVDIVKEAVEFELEKEKRKLAIEQQKSEILLSLEYEKDLRELLKKQAEAHTDHIQEVIQMKESQAERLLKQKYDDELENIKINYDKQLAKLIGKMKGLDASLKARAESHQKAQKSQLLWTACQSLISTVKSGVESNKPVEEQLKPLKPHVSAISKAAVEEDELIEAVLATIPKEALSRGVFPELVLRERFLNLEKIAYRIANVPEGYATLPSIFLSYLQSFLIMSLSDPIPVEEIANEPIDPSLLNNYDVLCRARYWIDRGDFTQTLRYMNLLKGASRALANEWMNETRIFLETQQAANALLTYAVYSNLVFVKNL